jgi:hypothetical protein
MCEKRANFLFFINVLALFTMFLIRFLYCERYIYKDILKTGIHTFIKLCVKRIAIDQGQ